MATFISVTLTGCDFEGATIKMHVGEMVGTINGRISQNVEILNELYSMGGSSGGGSILSEHQYNTILDQMNKTKDRFQKIADGKVNEAIGLSEYIYAYVPLTPQNIIQFGGSVKLDESDATDDGFTSGYFLEVSPEDLESGRFYIAADDKNTFSGDKYNTGRWNGENGQSGTWPGQFTIVDYLINSGGTSAIGKAEGKATLQKADSALTDSAGTVYVQDKASVVSLVGGNYTYSHTDGTLNGKGLGDSKELVNQINNAFNYTIYVLKPDVLTSDGQKTLDGVYEVIRGVNNLGNEKKDSYLQQYFEKATSADGKTELKFVETKDGEIPERYRLIQMSDPSMIGGNIDSFNIEDKPGNPLIIKEWGLPCMAVLLMEFNQEAVDAFKQITGDNVEKYYFTSHGGNNNAYLMEYPVQVMTGLKEVDNGKVQAIFSDDEEYKMRSGIATNIMTGKIIKTFEDGSQAIDDTVEQYYSTGGAKNEIQTGLSSFVLSGYNKVDLERRVIDESGNLVTDTSTLSVYTGRIILRDYLEAVYAPTCVQDHPEENLVTFGRKIRLQFNFQDDPDNKIEYNHSDGTDYLTNTKQVWSKTDDMGYYVDINGDKLDTFDTVKVTDLCDAYNLVNGTEPGSLDSLPASNGDYSESTLKYFTPPDIEPFERDATKPSGAAKLPRVKNLKTDGVSGKGETLRTTVEFPSNLMGISDYENSGGDAMSTDTANNKMQRFYCLAVRQDVFDNQLFSNWINVESETRSLNWWNKYLSSCGMTYGVSHEQVNNWLANNYSYDLADSGATILDLDTVREIQKMYNKESNKDIVEKIRTIFMIMGYFIICYSAVLLLCWTLDTNAGVSVGLLEKATLGHWVAVKYKEDIPASDAEERSYITGSAIFLRCIILILVGVILVRTNIFRLIVVLIDVLGRFAEQVLNMLNGN